MILQAIATVVCFGFMAWFFIEFIKLVDKQKKYDRENRKD